MGKYFLTIDRGQTSIKAALCDVNGNVDFVESCKCESIISRHSGWAEQDMDLIWRQTIEVIKNLLNNSRIRSSDVKAISFSGQGGGNFLISENGKAVYPGVLSMDSRHEEISDLIEDKDIPRTVAFMRWLKEKEPDIFQSVRWILGSKDWIRYCMSGTVAADMSDPAVPVDLDKGEYKIKCLADAGVPECEAMLPPLYYAAQVCGYVTKEAAKETGLMEGTPIVCGAHDMIACSLGSGGIRQGHLAIIMGTMGINIAVSDMGNILPPENVPGESFEFAGVVKGMRTVTTSIGSGCSTMDYFLDLFCDKEKEQAKQKGVSLFNILEEELQDKGPTDVVVQPYLMGTFYNSSAKAGILGITARTTKEDILLGVYQGICLSMCLEIEKLEKRVQVFDDIWLVGGGSRSKIWGQMFADVLGRPVKICSSDEVGCRGAALCCGLALGYYTLINGFPKTEASKIWYPRREYTEIYQKQLDIYRKVYDRSTEF